MRKRSEKLRKAQYPGQEVVTIWRNYVCNVHANGKGNYRRQCTIWNSCWVWTHNSINSSQVGKCDASNSTHKICPCNHPRDNSTNATSSTPLKSTYISIWRWQYLILGVLRVVNCEDACSFPYTASQDSKDNNTTTPNPVIYRTSPSEY